MRAKQKQGGALAVDEEFRALIPPLAEGERAQLEANLKADGCISPVVTWRGRNTILDGHNRVAICERLGIGFRVVQKDFSGREAAAAWVIRTQIGRRNLTRYQRAELALKLKSLIAAPLKERQREGGRKKVVPKSAQPSKTRDELAKVAGVGHDTIAKVEYLDKHADEDVKGKLRAGEVSVNAAYRAVRKEKQRAEKAEAKAAIPDDLPAATDRYVVHHGDLATVGQQVEADSIDWIITDPPYPKKYLPVYGELGSFAARVLKPGGSLVCMAGQSFLPEVMALLSEHLTYNWSLAYLTPGGQAVQVWERRVNCFFKPLLWFVKGKYTGEWVGDVCRSNPNDNDKEHHHWGQSESGMADIIDRFTFPGETICDPFCGGGTTGVVAVRMNRLFVGIDKDEEAVATTLRRLTEAVRA
ncbi:MAG TPA: DNA modification methylase [Phycisphaerae bacterium]|nr:DNA modification methylase [Phycisphaerae bacterium]